MAVKRANTTRRPASGAAAGKPAKGQSAGSKSAKGQPARSKSVKAGKPRAAQSGVAAKRPVAQRGVSAQSSRVKGKGTGAARPAVKKSSAAGTRGAKSTRPLSGAARVVQVVEGALDEMKAAQVRVLDVRQLTDIADTLIIASGNSDRHVRSIAERVVEHAKKAGLRAMGVEGQRDGEWVLVDLQDVIVHVMLPRIRELYRLEDLWDVSAARREAALDKVAV